MNILALDLGTKCGWAELREGEVSGGTWILATPKEISAQKKAGLDRCCDCRFIRLQTRISGRGPLDWVYFEDVQFSVSTQQTQLWASMRCIVTLLYPAVKLRAVPVGTLKKFATGKGNATKEEMAQALYMGGNRVFEGVPEGLVRKGIFLVDRDSQCPLDDNEVDARHLLNCARAELKV